MNYFHLGNMTIPSIWLAVLFSSLFVPILYRIVFKQKIDDSFFNGLFYFILVWKLSYILFNFDLFVQSPQSVLYFDGGMKGHILALAVISVYYYIQARKKGEFCKHAYIVFLLFFLCYEMFFYISAKNITATIIFAGLLSGVIAFINIRKKVLPPSAFILFLLIYFLAISFFQPIFSIKSGTVLFLGMVMLIICKFQNEVQFK